MILSQVFSPSAINIDLESIEKDEVFEEIVEGLIASYSGLNRTGVLNALLERESKLSTGIGKGFAVPHGVCAGVSGVKGFIGISREGIDFDSLDNVPVQVIFTMISGENECEYHLQVIKRLADVIKQPNFIKTLLSKTSPQEIYDALIRFEESATATI